MSVLIILGKLGILASYLSIVKMIYDMKKADSNVRFELDLLSTIEFFAGIGLALVGLVAVIDKTTYFFTFGLSVVSIAIGLIHRYRLILAGDRKVLFAGSIHDIKEIKNLSSGMFTLKVHTKSRQKPYSIYVPLTSNNVLKNKVQAKLKNTKKSQR